jgi:4,5-DOPA dioxygenase extradiol
MLGRRDTVRLLAAGAAAAAATAGGLSGGAAGRDPGPHQDRKQGQAGRMPAIFLAHGAPPLLDMPGWMGELRTWAEAMPRPKAILVLSAHWEQRPVTLGATRTVPLIYDFYGFPERYYQQQYRAPGAPALAARVRQLLGTHGPVADDPERGLDHGAYVPLVAMYPAADVPVLQVSLPGLAPEALLALGRALAPLRDEGALIMGSGFLTHNLRLVDWRPDAPVPTWAAEFDAWAAEALGRNDVDALVDFQRKAPGARVALPTTEHYVPVLAALGAAGGGAKAPRFPITGFWMGGMTRRSVEWE